MGHVLHLHQHHLTQVHMHTTLLLFVRMLTPLYVNLPLPMHS